MEPIFSAEELHSIVGGNLVQSNWEVSGVSTDSRNIKKNDLFIAIKAKRDGNDFLLSAINNGAKAAIISRLPAVLPANFPYILVKDGMKALNDMALYSRKRYKGKLIAITGSVGKTSTKDILTKMLSVFGLTHSSPKSYNNNLGVSLTLVNIPKKTEYVICEIGMNRKGEIAPLSTLVAPDVAIITNISAAHLASFENLEEIANEKASICLGLNKNGLVIFSKDNKFYDLIMNFINNKKVKSITFGSNTFSDISLKNISFFNNQSFAKLVIKNKVFSDFKINSLGLHQLLNCLAAVGVINHYNYDIKLALNELQNWEPRDGRGKCVDLNFKTKLETIKIKIIDESYNCNPTSLNASFEILKSISFKEKKTSSRKIAILGDMLELGNREKEFHRKIAKNINIKFFNTIHCVGSLMKELYLELPEAKKGLLVEKSEDLFSYILSNMKNGDIYLIKGSNSMGLSFIVNKLYDLNNNYI